MTLPQKMRDNMWKPGQSGNAGGLTKAVLEVRNLCQKLGPDVIARLGTIALQAEDLRAAIEASKVILARGYGKEREAEGLADRDNARTDNLPDVDLKSLSSDQITRIEAILKESAA